MLRSGSGRKRSSEQQHAILAVGNLHLPAAFGDEAVDKPGGSRARRDLLLVGLAQQRLLELGIEYDAGSLPAHDDIEAAVMPFRTDVKTSAAHQRVTREQDEIEQDLERRLAHRRLVDHP